MLESDLRTLHGIAQFSVWCREELALLPIETAILATLALCERELTVAEIMAYNSDCEDGQTYLEALEGHIECANKLGSLPYWFQVADREVTRYGLTSEGKEVVQLVVQELQGRME